MQDSQPAPALTGELNVRLSLMMFLQYAIWGAWLPILWPFLGHLGFSNPEKGYVIAVGAVGAIVGPFFAGQIADRYLATEKLLALLHLVGAGLMYFLTQATTFQSWLLLSLAYGVVYGPTLALTNSLAFAHLQDRDRDFGRVRVWGTMGWIAVGIGVGQWLSAKHVSMQDGVRMLDDGGRLDAFFLAMGLGVAMAVYSLTLPHTPPSRESKGNASTKAIGAVGRQPLLTLFVISVLVAIVHQFYFVFTAAFLTPFQAQADGFVSSVNRVLGEGGGGLMTIGQMSELLVLAFVIPFLAPRVSRKALLSLGLAAYAGRMALFAYTDSLATVILGVALHGLCFGSFIFVAFMVVDEETTGDIRASAQNLYNLVIVGVGVGVGSLLSGHVAALATPDGAEAPDYPLLFSWVFYAALAGLAAHLLFYPGGRKAVKA